VSRLSRKGASLDISQPYSPPRPYTGITLLFYVLLLRDRIYKKVVCTELRATKTPGGVQ
jgi:hypothetical protein